MKNGDKPAFSSLHTIDGNWQKDPRKEYQGLTKREYFAAICLGHAVDKWYNHSDEELVSRSIKLADELLKALES